MERAKALGIKQGVYSLLVGGRRGLSPKRIETFAKKLAGGDTEKFRQLHAELEEIVTANRVPRRTRLSSFEEAVKDFFRRGGQRDALICCEYRDLPRANKGAPYERAAELAGEA